MHNTQQAVELSILHYTVLNASGYELFSWSKQISKQQKKLMHKRTGKHVYMLHTSILQDQPTHNSLTTNTKG